MVSAATQLLNDYEKMRAAFVRPHGTHTAANSSFLTDGAAATMLMSAEKAESLEGCSPKAYLRDWTCQAVDPFDELLLGPAYCIAQILHSNNLQMSDIDVWEIHEAFAGQVLANLAALRSTKFCQEKLGRDTAVGEVDHSKLNLLGDLSALAIPSARLAAA